jgi:hypothetical protein
MFVDYDEDDDYENEDEFHSVFTIQLGELIHDGLVNFNDGTWDSLQDGTPIDWYNEAQEKRLYAKLQQRYYYREIGELPYKRWKNDLLSRLAAIMPKYYLAYAALDKGVNLMQLRDIYAKHRNIYSDFPQTMLSDNEDYASTGNDNESEEVTEGNFVSLVKSLRDSYNDPDKMILDEIDIMFNCMLTSNINGY